ncbi:fumarylacetoacetate hydrolase family protein [Nocardioides sp. BYT-33-1]|uniref:fumarylacetoacetate hydrolase family protein n=1 Tax=Nocardioides sp. BYT-33-1 TaxID=3416952 RepID=UPI003F53B74A
MRITAIEVDGARRYAAVDGEALRLLGTKEAPAPDLVSAASATPGDVLSGSGRRLVPVTPGKIVAVGLNYLDHVRETGMALPTEPLLFAKFPSSVIGDGDRIRFDPGLTTRVDWEVELGVVIGRTARDVSEEVALSHVLGYTVVNDVSARDLQFADGQWTRGKNLDTFCPVGSEVVTADEVPDPQRLRMGTDVNGERVQDSSTAEMVFSVARIVAHCSRAFTLEPGDLILTGTPWGCGEFMTPQRSLRHGDRVTVWVEGIGAVTNTVDAAPRVG